MYFHPNERLAVFIDAPRLLDEARALDLHIDFKKLHDVFQKSAVLTQTYFYASVAEDGGEMAIRPLLTWLAYHGYLVIEVSDRTRERRRTRALEVALAVGAMAVAPSVDHVVLMTGNGDFSCLARRLQGLGKRVSVCSTLKGRPYLDDELRRQADQFVDLDDIRDLIARDHDAP